MSTTRTAPRARPAWPGWLGPRLAAFDRMSPRTRVLLALLAAWVGVPGLLIGVLEWRRLSFGRRAFEHRAGIIGKYEAIDWQGNHDVLRLDDVEVNGTPLAPRQIHRNHWHRAMYAKYADAQASPWWPVAADPPMPDLPVRMR